MALSALRLIACAAVLFCFCAMDVSAQACQGALILSVTCSDPVADAITSDDPNQVSGLYSCGEPLDSLQGNGAEHVFLFTPQVSGEVTFGLSNMNCDLDLYVLASGCDPDDDCIAGSTHGSTTDESIMFDAIQGTTYYLIIEVRDAMPDWPCTYTLAVLSIGSGGCPEDCNNGIDDNLNGAIDCEDPVCGPDTDGDGLCDLDDPDDDNDGVPDNDDPNPLDPNSCGDADNDSCDDCAIGTDDFGPLDDFDPANDGPDTDGDGLCDLGDPDDDNDGVPDNDDPNPLDPNSCGDADNDSCDDCAVGTDDFGPMPDFDTSNDGPDMDFDGICDLSDNCINQINPLQSDLNNNGIGDVCDTTFYTVDNVGIGTDTPKTRLHVAGGIPFIDNTSAGFLMRAADGSCWFVSISNVGVLTSIEVDCPE